MSRRATGRRKEPGRINKDVAKRIRLSVRLRVRSVVSGLAEAQIYAGWQSTLRHHDRTRQGGPKMVSHSGDAPVPSVYRLDPLWGRRLVNRRLAVMVSPLAAGLGQGPFVTCEAAGRTVTGPYEDQTEVSRQGLSSSGKDRLCDIRDRVRYPLPRAMLHPYKKSGAPMPQTQGKNMTEP